jgi:hypothetical protein
VEEGGLTEHQICAKVCGHRRRFLEARSNPSFVSAVVKQVPDIGEKMRLLPLGDPHLEDRPLDDIAPLDVESFDVLVAAGDLWEGQPEKAVQSVVAIA